MKAHQGQTKGEFIGADRLFASLNRGAQSSDRFLKLFSEDEQAVGVQHPQRAKVRDPARAGGERGDPFDPEQGRHVREVPAQASEELHWLPRHRQDQLEQEQVVRRSEQVKPPLPRQVQLKVCQPPWQDCRQCEPDPR